MADFMNLVESYDSATASIQNIFGNDGTAVQSVSRRNRNNPRYQQQLVEAASFYGQVLKGTRPLWQLREALSTSDFPLYLADTIDRMVLANYQNRRGSWREYLYTTTVQDFRTVKRFRFSDGNQRLKLVGQGESYPARELDEASYTYSVNKYGARFDLLWELMQNDDLGMLRQLPQRMATAAIRTEDYFASSLYVANTTLYETTHGVNGTDYSNKGTDQLDLAALETAINTMSAYPGDVNSDGVVEPIMNQPVYLVVPPQLEITAQKIVASNLQYVDSTETNVLRGRLQVRVDPYIPIIDTTNGATSWYLFADPANGHAAEVGFLAGHEAPQMFVKSPNALAMSGGSVAATDGDFDTDSISYKVRHVVGGSHANAVGGWRFTYWSDGSGS